MTFLENMEKHETGPSQDFSQVEFAQPMQTGTHQWNNPISLGQISHVLPDSVIKQHNGRLITFGVCNIHSDINL